MLKQRIITAVLLLALILPALIYSAWSWALLSLLFLALAAFEWSRLLAMPERNGAKPRRSAALGAAAAMLVLGAGYLTARHVGALPANAARWLAALALGFWMLEAPRRLSGAAPMRAGGIALALALLMASWVALVELRFIGIWAILTTMAVVWIADIAAYFIGRAWGQRKLAPRISPNKSWEGALGGAAAVALLGVASTALWPESDQSLSNLLAQRLGQIGAVVVLLGLAGLSVIGDLAESLLKREAGAKDSGTTLPGHGGMLDRIDALLPVLPAGLLAFELLR